MVHGNVAALICAATLLLAACGQGGGGAPATNSGGTSSGTGLTGATREQFVRGAVMSCTQKGATDPAMAAMPQDKIAAYCDCSSKALADRLSEADIATINADPAKARETMGPRIQAAAMACKSTLQ